MWCNVTKSPAQRTRLHVIGDNCFAQGCSLRKVYSPRTASLMPPIAFWTLPAAFCALPSPSSLASPVALPATSFTLPLACSQEPSARSLSMVPSPFLVAMETERIRAGQVPQLHVTALG